MPLQESLQRDLHITLPVGEHAISDYLVGSLDEQGFLTSSVQEIATMLSIAVRPAETHRAHIMQKLQRGSRAALVRYALQHGLLDEGAAS